MTQGQDDPQFRDNGWTQPEVSVEKRADGSYLLSSPKQASAIPRNVIQLLRAAARDVPGRTFLAERGADEQWVHLAYRDANAQSDAVASWFLGQGYEPGTRVMILSENSLAHAVFSLGAMKARLTVVPVSPGYSLFSEDHAKLRRIAGLATPRAVFVQDTTRYSRALDALDLSDCPVIAVQGERADVIDFDTLLQQRDPGLVNASINAIEPDDIAKLLFTSGSTGEPKGVINTHHNMCFPHAALSAVFHPDQEQTTPVTLDWLPWHHTFGGNQNFNRTLYYAGTMYIDDGKPTPELFACTVRNLREIAVTAYSTVPAVYGVLLDLLEKDAALCTQFFSRLEWLSYGGADLPQSLFDRIQALAVRETGQKIPVITALGSTESNSILTIVHWNNETMGNIGLPVPGTQMKLIPLGDKFEMRVKGPQMARGYFHDEAKTAEAFDEEGFFRTGDAVRWADPEQPERGLLFAGRVAEDFKLSNGTWVHTGSLRTRALSALSPLLADLVITGHDRDELGALAWLNEEGVRALLGEACEGEANLPDSPAVKAALQAKLQAWNAAHNHASTAIRRLCLLRRPASLDKGEITDKRYVNQRAVLQSRYNRVEELYQDPPGATVILG